MNTYIIDFEFRQLGGDPPRVWCVAWRCLETKEEGSLWLDGTDSPSPFPEKFRMIAHYALAELACFRKLGWPLPTEVIDTLPEARVTCGQVPYPTGSWSLLGTAAGLGIQTMSSEHKDSMRNLALQDEVAVKDRHPLMEYCLTDVRACAAVYEAMQPFIMKDYAILRGRYLLALSAAEELGIPVDVDLVERIHQNMDSLKVLFQEATRESYPGVYTDKGTFSSQGWLEYCEREHIPWPTLPTGNPKLDKDTFKQISDSYPQVRLMANTRALLGSTRAIQFPVGEDGRMRCMLSPFGSDTGRNQPSNSHYVFGMSAWMRSVIKAPPGRVLAYVDYTAQEVALAAHLSGDTAMMDDYQSGDIYMGFAIRAGAAPKGATKQSHPEVRSIYKTVVLGVQYGMGVQTLAARLKIPLSAANRLIASHKTVYSNYWQWRQDVADHVCMGGTYSTRFGWIRKRKLKDKSGSITNFPTQATGAEILRVAVIALEEAGHRVIAPVHDAVMVELNELTWREELADVRQLMTRAASAVAPGTCIPTSADIVFPGENYVDERGEEIWKHAVQVIGRKPYRDPSRDNDRIVESQI